MNEKDDRILQKVKAYIQDAISYTQGLTFEQFMADGKTISATAFVIGQMGELANNISPETRETYPDFPWRELRGMRNRIVHDYENVDHIILWQTITEDLPLLTVEIDRLQSDQDVTPETLT
jgi:uncharacterized protein with HEPN domain